MNRAIDYLLTLGVEEWNRLRNLPHHHPEFNPVIRRADFHDIEFVIESANREDSKFTHPMCLKNINLQQAQLSFAGIPNADLSDSKLFYAQCVRTLLSNANLTNAHLDSVNFSSANLSEANLTNADLTRANLQNANLHDADLTRTNLNLTNLTNTNLARTTLNETDLTTIDLTDVNLIESEPWKARLFETTPDLPRQYPHSPNPIESISELIKEVRGLQQFYVSNTKNVLFFFRGESKWEWCLTPSVLREEFHTLESEMLLELMAQRPTEFNKLPSSLEHWVLAQHHGLKTRFLDVTKNPLVALFHACEPNSQFAQNDARLHVFAVPLSLVKPFNSDTVSIVSNFAKLSHIEQDLLLGKKFPINDDEFPLPNDFLKARTRLYHLIQNEKPYFQNRINFKDLFRVLVVEPQLLSERVRAQSGAFLVSAFHHRFERTRIIERCPNTPVYAHYMLRIPHKSKTSIFEELNLINVRREILYPGLDESAKAILNSFSTKPQ